MIQQLIGNDVGEPPLGLRGLPLTREALDAMAADLCARVQSAGGRSVSGIRLAQELRLLTPHGRDDARAVRLLVAYCRVWLRRHEIVGVPGEGYFWAPNNPDKTRRIIRLAGRMGRCWFYISALLRREGAAMAMAQMVFDFAKSAQPGSRDELAALVAAEGVTPAGVMDAMIRRLASDPAGRQTLADLAARHADVLLPRAVLQDAAARIAEIGRHLLQIADRPAPAGTPLDGHITDPKTPFANGANEASR